jgi:hypothetical protein
MTLFKIKELNMIGTWSWNTINDVCTICRVSIVEPSIYDTKHSKIIVSGECGHAFHNKCIHKWLGNRRNRKCPNCNLYWKYKENKQEPLKEAELSDEETDLIDDSINNYNHLTSVHDYSILINARNFNNAGTDPTISRAFIRNPFGAPIRFRPRFSLDAASGVMHRRPDFDIGGAGEPDFDIGGAGEPDFDIGGAGEPDFDIGGAGEPVYSEPSDAWQSLPDLDLNELELPGLNELELPSQSQWALPPGLNELELPSQIRPDLAGLELSIEYDMSLPDVVVLDGFPNDTGAGSSRESVTESDSE